MRRLRHGCISEQETLFVYGQSRVISVSQTFWRWAGGSEPPKRPKQPGVSRYASDCHPVPNPEDNPAGLQPKWKPTVMPSSRIVAQFGVSPPVAVWLLPGWCG